MQPQRRSSEVKRGPGLRAPARHGTAAPGPAALRPAALGPAPPGRRRPHGGFSLVEALVGLALLSLVLTAALAVTYRLPRDLERLEARRQANRAAESALETVRARAMPLVPGRQEWPATAPAPPERRLRTWVEITPADTPSLFHVAVEVEYQVLGEARSTSLETLAWQP